jgi:hypothetical protein
MTTRDKVIELLVKERTDARNLAYQFKDEYDSKAKYGLKSLKWHYEKIADICRQIGNSISGGNALAMDETIKDRIVREYSEELKQFDNE